MCVSTFGPKKKTNQSRRRVCDRPLRRWACLPRRLSFLLRSRVSIRPPKLERPNNQTTTGFRSPFFYVITKCQRPVRETLLLLLRLLLRHQRVFFLFFFVDVVLFLCAPRRMKETRAAISPNVIASLIRCDNRTKPRAMCFSFVVFFLLFMPRLVVFFSLFSIGFALKRCQRPAPSPVQSFPLHQ